MQKIRKELFPDIQYGSETICTNGEDSPLVRVLEKEEYKGKIIVSGEGSIGKSTMLTDLRLRLLEKEKAYVYFNLRDLNVGIDDKSVKDLINNYEGNDLIVILDSYDETSISPDRYGNTPRKTAEELIEYCAGNDKVALLVVGVRQGCKSTHEMRVEHGGFSATQGFQCNQENAEKNYLEFDKWAQERGFRIAKLQRFSDEKIDLILSERKGVSRELRELLRNTMFLSMFLEDPVLDWESATNEAKFIDKYFEEVFCDKLERQDTANREIIKEKLFSTICDIGENVFCGFYRLKRDKLELEVYTELNTIFTQEQIASEWEIKSIQEKYLSYCVAKFLSNYIDEKLEIFMGKGTDELFVQHTWKQKNHMVSEGLIDEGLYYLGQLLSDNQISHIKYVLHETEDVILFRNLSQIILGHTGGKIIYGKIALHEWDRHIFSNNIRLKSINLPENTKHIDSDSFSGCGGLERIEISENNRRYKSIGGNLYSKDGTVLIKYSIGKPENAFVVPNHVKTIGVEAFTGSKNLKHIFIPSGVKKIEDMAFSDCQSLEEVNIPEGVEKIGDFAFSGCEVLSKLIISSCTKTIGRGAFSGCISLEKVNVPEGAEQIGIAAFHNCKSLKEITIHSSIKVIAAFVFGECGSLDKVNGLKGVQSIEMGAFYGCKSLKTVVFSDSLKKIGDRAFQDSGLERILIPESVTFIDERAFESCKFLKQIDVAKNNCIYKSIDGNLYRKDQSRETIVKFSNEQRTVAFKIPSFVSSIGSFSFAESDILQEIILNNGAKIICAYAFAGCRSLIKVIISSSVTLIGECAFSNCILLEEVIIPNGVEVISYGAFSDCRSLKKLLIPVSVKTIACGAFDGCESLKTLYYGGTKKEWAEKGFENCDGLADADIYFYSETHPEESGDYWHFGEDGKTPVIW